MSFQTFVGNIFGDTEPRVWLVFIVSVKSNVGLTKDFLFLKLKI